MRLPGLSVGAIVLRIAVLIVVLVLAIWATQAMREALDLQIRPDNEQQVHRMMMLGAVACIGLLALPFLPRAEIGLALLTAFSVPGRAERSGPVARASFIGGRPIHDRR